MVNMPLQNPSVIPWPFMLSAPRISSEVFNDELDYINLTSIDEFLLKIKRVSI